MTLLHPAIEGVSFGISSSRSLLMPRLLRSSKLSSSSTTTPSSSSSSSTYPADKRRSAAIVAAGSITTAKTTPSSTSSSSSSSSDDEEQTSSSSSQSHESLLAQLTSELETERGRRIDLEERVAEQLLRGFASSDDEHESAASPTSSSSSSETPPPPSAREVELLSELTALRTERDGLRETVEAVTTAKGGGGNDAVRFASKPENEGKTLPVDAVRLLEIMPWEAAAGKHASAIEEVYEWEMYDRATGSWTGRYRSFPDDFKCVPVVKPRTAMEAATTAEHDEHARTHFWARKVFSAAAGVISSSDTDSDAEEDEDAPERADAPDCVLTNEGCTEVLDTRGGYPLPSAGTWEWVGEWAIDRRRKRRKGDDDGGESDDDSDEELAPCDADGWSYATQPKLLVSSRAGDRRSTSGLNVERKFRRRRWTRRRALVSYPSASDMALNFLALSAKNAKLTRGAERLAEKVRTLEVRLEERDEELRRLGKLREEEMAHLGREIEAMAAAAAAAAHRGGEEYKVLATGGAEEVCGELSSGRGKEVLGGEEAPPQPCKRPANDSSGEGGDCCPTPKVSNRAGCSTVKSVASTKGPDVVDNNAPPSSLLSEVRGYAAASAWGAMSRLYRINEAVDVRGDHPEALPSDDSIDDGDISLSLQKAMSREDSTLDGDAATEPTSGFSSSGEESSDDTISVLSEARSEVSSVYPVQQRRLYGVGGAAVLDRLMSRTPAVRAAGAGAASAATIDLDLDLDGQVGKEIYVTSSEVLPCADSGGDGVLRQEQAQHVQQIQPFSSPTIRF